MFTKDPIMDFTRLVLLVSALLIAVSLCGIDDSQAGAIQQLCGWALIFFACEVVSHSRRPEKPDRPAALTAANVGIFASWTLIGILTVFVCVEMGLRLQLISPKADLWMFALAWGCVFLGAEGHYRASLFRSQHLHRQQPANI